MFVSDLWATDDDVNVRCNFFQDADDAAGFVQVPDVNAETNNPWRMSKQPLNDDGRLIMDGEFVNRRARCQIAQVCVQVAQPQRRMTKACVQRTK